jgi:uncharacterized protein
MKILFVLVGILFLVGVGVFLYTWYRLHDSLAGHVAEDGANVGKYPGLKPETVFFTTSDGVKIASWYLPVKRPRAFVILVHGYEKEKGGKALMLPYADFLTKAGYSTLLVDLRSFGESEGSHITLGVKEWRDVVGAYDYVKGLPEAKNKRVGVLGISMGAVTSLIAAGESGKGDFVVASVPYGSYRSLFDFRVRRDRLYSPIFLPPLLWAANLELGVGFAGYDPVKEIEKIRVPVLLFSASKDMSVPPDDARRLFDLANKPKGFWRAEAEHDIWVDKPEEFKRRVLEFLGKYGG